MNWLKKGPLLAVAGGVLLVWVFVVFFFDSALKHALITGGQAAAGAKVEIGFLRTRWLKGSLVINRIAVADHEQPMKNILELSRAAFQFDVSAALRGKAVIREAALEGLRQGTARTTSGALRRRPPPSALTLAVAKQIAPVKEAALSKVSEAKSSIASEIDISKLSALKKLEEAKAKSKEIEERWKGKSSEIKEIEKEAREVAEQLKALGGGSSFDIFKKARSAKQAQERIKALISRVDAQKAEAQKDIGTAQALMKEADELRQKDLNGLLSAAGLPGLSSTDIARRLLGAQTASRLATALHWMQLARARAAAKKAPNPPPPPRRQGLDIEFPRAHSYPRFLLEGAKITGTLDGVMGGALDLNGELGGVTSNPQLYGKPATLAVAGKSASGSAAMLNARLDQQKDPVGVSLDFNGEGFSLAGTQLGDDGVGGAIKDGRAQIKGHLSSSGDDWNGEIFLSAVGVVIEPRVSLNGASGALVAEALKSLSGFNVRIGISGSEKDLKLAFSSNIGEAVSAAMKKALAGQIEAQKKILEAKLASIYGDRFKDARASTDGLASKLLGPLDAQKSALNKQLSDALGHGIGKTLNFNKLFK